MKGHVIHPTIPTLRTDITESLSSENVFAVPLSRNKSFDVRDQGSSSSTKEQAGERYESAGFVGLKRNICMHGHKG
jgi:hypothetical protein